MLLGNRFQEGLLPVNTHHWTEIDFSWNGSTLITYQFHASGGTSWKCHDFSSHRFSRIVELTLSPMAPNRDSFRRNYVELPCHPGRNEHKLIISFFCRWHHYHPHSLFFSIAEIFWVELSLLFFEPLTLRRHWPGHQSVINSLMLWMPYRKIAAAAAADVVSIKWIPVELDGIKGNLHEKRGIFFYKCRPT